jgi:hypothetical protein
MRVVFDITNQEDIAWLETIPKEKKNEIIRNSITIGRLAIENCKMNIDSSKYLQPVIDHFKTITQLEVQKALDSITSTREQLNETREEFEELSRGIKQEVKQNSSTMVECVKSQASLTEKLLEPINSRIDKMNQEVEKIFSVKASSNVKGKLGESIVAQHIQTAFPSYEVQNMSQSPHEADYHIHTDFGKILLEIKTYQNTVNKEQIEKFYKDIDRTGISLAIFLSTTSGIVGKKHIEWEIYGPNKTIILYFPNSTMNLESVVFSFLFLKALVDLGFNKGDQSGVCMAKSNEEVIELFKMFDSFYKDLMELLEKQTKLRYQIYTVKNVINKSIDDLYKQSFDMELEHKGILEAIYGKLKSRMVAYDRPMDIYKPIGDSMELSGILVALGIKAGQVTALKVLYSCLGEGYKMCQEKEGGKEPKFVIVKDGKIECSVVVSKTKIEALFDVPKSSSSISIHPKYETFKSGQICLAFENELECIGVFKARCQA